MPTEQQLTVLLGPLGLTAGLLFLVWLFVTERVVPKGRLDDQKEQTKDALDIARQANESLDRMASAVEARNQLDTERARIEAERLRTTGERRRSSE